jgi:hypothetical protein
MELDQFNSLTTAFHDQLLACLEECAHGRRGLFAEYQHLGESDHRGWPETSRLRELAAAHPLRKSRSGRHDPKRSWCHFAAEVTLWYDGGKWRSRWNFSFEPRSAKRGAL